MNLILAALLVVAAIPAYAGGAGVLFGGSSAGNDAGQDITPNTVTATSSVTASAFFGDGSHLAGLTDFGPSTATLSASTVTLAGRFVTNSSSGTNTSANGLLVTSSVTAGALFGDASHLTGIPTSNTVNSSLTVNGQLLVQLNDASTNGPLIHFSSGVSNDFYFYGSSVVVVSSATTTLTLMNNGGTSANPSSLGFGTTMGRINFSAFDTATPASGVAFSAIASTPWTTTSHGSFFKLLMSSDTVTSQETVIYATGTAGGRIGIGSNAVPGETLDVNGNATIRGQETITSTLTVQGAGGMVVAKITGTTTSVTFSTSVIITSTLTVQGTGGISAANIIVTSTLTVQGNAFSVGASTLVVTGGKVGIGTNAPTTPLTVYGIIASSTTVGSISCSAGTAVLSATCSDQHCTFLSGIAATACTYTFGHTLTQIPSCVAGTDAAIPIAVSVTSPATTSITLTAAAAMTGDNVTFICNQNP